MRFLYTGTFVVVVVAMGMNLSDCMLAIELARNGSRCRL